MRTRIGKCSLCGGDVIGWTGAWHGVIPPRPAECIRCGATVYADTIKMIPRPTSKAARTSDPLALYTDRLPDE